MAYQISVMSSEKTMSSREIAELTAKPHDNVLKLIRSLVKEGIVKNTTPSQYIHPQNKQSYTEYLCNKRDSLVIVARLSPEFTAAVVDRWQYLEEQKLTNPAQLTKLEILQMALESEQKVLELTQQVEELKPESEAFQRIAKADGSMCMTDAAKALQVKPTYLIKWLSTNSWIYRRQGNKNWLGYQEKVQKGYLEHKVTEQIMPDGEGRIYEQVRVTPKGLTAISKKLNSELGGAA